MKEKGQKNKAKNMIRKSKCTDNIFVLDLITLNVDRLTIKIYKTKYKTQRGLGEWHKWYSSSAASINRP
jgi:hypothetical protein